MRRDVVTIDERHTCRDAADRMARARVRRLSVVDRDGVLAGILTDRDRRPIMASETSVGSELEIVSGP